MWLSLWKQLLRRSIGQAWTARRRQTFRKGYRPLLEVLEDRTVPSMTFTVTTTADSLAAGTLRTAIMNANANPGTDVVNFAIPGAGTQIIGLLSPLPNISNPVTIDGTTQGSHLIVLDGTSAGGMVEGLTLGAGSAGSTIKGLVIDNFTDSGIRVMSNQNLITGNFIGVDASGTQGKGNFPFGSGINLTNATGNLIQSNVISGNAGDGITMNGATRNVVFGNSIGVDAAGANALGNNRNGVYLINSRGNVVQGNVLSGNGMSFLEG